MAGVITDRRPGGESSPIWRRSSTCRAEAADRTTSASRYSLGKAVTNSSAARSATGFEATSISITRAACPEERTMSAVSSEHPLQTTTTSSSPGRNPSSKASRQRLMTAASLWAGITTDPSKPDAVTNPPAFTLS